MQTREKIFINGMHCASCEILIANNLKKIGAVKAHKISHRKGFVELSYEKEEDREKAIQAIKELGYHPREDNEQSKQNPDTKNSFKDYTQIAGILLGLIVIASIAKQANFYQYLPSIGEEINVVLALLLGLIASVSTCLALIGGIVISFGSAYDIEGNRKKFSTYAKPHIFFHMGRLASFIILGGTLGAIGSAIKFSLDITSYLTLAVSIIMIYVGLQILNIVPNITKLGFHLPKSLSSKIHSLQTTEHKAAPFLIGALTFFLPCGFTQSAQLAAIATGTFFSGALIMGAFALGTLPVLLALGISSSYSQKMKLDFFKKVIGVLIISFAIFSFTSGLRLVGININLSTTTEQNAQEITLTDDGYQEVHMTVNWGFEPNNFTIKKDVPVRWIIDGKNVSGCVSEIIIPTLNKTFVLKSDENIFEFTPTETGPLNFSCWMGMVSGKFTVIE